MRAMHSNWLATTKNQIAYYSQVKAENITFEMQRFERKDQ